MGTIEPLGQSCCCCSTAKSGLQSVQKDSSSPGRELLQLQVSGKSIRPRRYGAEVRLLLAPQEPKDRCMNRREESHRSHEEGDGPQTPWIWNPPTLRESNERPIAAHDFPHSRNS